MTTEHDSNVDIRLLPNERLISCVQHPPRERTTRPSSLEQILRLTRANHPGEIGRFGPSIAALAFDIDTSPAHLRLYETVFGRDSLRVAIDLIPSYPELARTTILELAHTQGTGFYTGREEEVGRIVHEVRDPSDPIARELSEKLGWEWPYYGSVDATPEFIRTLTAYVQRSEENRAFLSEQYVDKNGNPRTISYALELALEWITRRRAANAEGLIEFQSVLEKGIENQVWKDSWDAYHHTDGTLANHSSGIASIEVQITSYDALIDAAELYEDVFDNGAVKAAALRSQAAALGSSILDNFWTDDKGGYFVLGTDRDTRGNLRQLEIRTSNMGHALNSRLLKGDDPRSIAKREAIIAQLQSPEMLAPAGIRTLATDEYRYRPGAYHNGSVWLWDTHHIAKGLRRLGYVDFADNLDDRLLNVIETTRAFPEYVRGDEDMPRLNTQTITLWDETNQRENKVEQPPQEVQAWTVAAIVATKKRRQRRSSTTPL